MKKLLVAMFVALLMAGCGGDTKKPAGDSPESNASLVETPPAKTAEVGGIDLDDNETRNRIIAEAIVSNKLQMRGKEGEELYYAPNEQTPYTGWVKYMSLFDNGQVWYIVQYKDGKMDGLMNRWHENGQKSAEVNFKDGKLDGLWIRYGEDGTEGYSGLYKDGEEVD